MRYTTAVILISAGFAAAQSAPECLAQNILDACLGTTKPQADTCTANDWNCLCTNYENILTCYNNCPGDSGRFGVQQQRDSYCNAAAAYPTTTARSTATATGRSSTSTAKATKTEEEDATNTEESEEETATATNAATSVAAPMGGLVALAFAILGIF